MASNNFIIYPNPFTTHFFINTPSAQNVSFELYDLSGKLVVQKKFVISASINTQSLPRGLYIYKVTDKEGRAMRGKVMKE